jgi:hypothetical protein
MTHEELVLCAEMYLWYTRRCWAVLTEPHSATVFEVPDAIGWKGGEAVVIECKTSYSDFLADSKKPHRNVGVGIGLKRYYMTKRNLIQVGELPSRWGLIEVGGEKPVIRKRARSFPHSDERAEKAILITALHNVQRPNDDEPDCVAPRDARTRDADNPSVGVAITEGE